MKKVPVSNTFSMVDDSDYERLSALNWSLSGYGYARAVVYGKKGRDSRGLLIPKVVKMHRMVVGAKEDELVDHINGNSLDNRRENLRICTMSQNLANQKIRKDSTSGFKGVCLGNNKTNKWRAYISKKEGEKTKQHHLGFFKTKEDAAKAYNKKAVELFGDFARLNKI